MQVQSGPDGMEIVQESHSEQIVEVAVDNQVQAQIAQEPRLIDMDLERMNVELYKGRYLTPDDFLDDIRRIVHNAHVRINEDPERLFRAQAMLTAAEVSIQDFDPQFRLECQRMAGRERKRREEFRKEKEKEKQPTQNGPYAPGTRRSARHNGQEPEIPITDISLLERRGKRQRSNGAETTPSEDENGERVAKKSRTDGEDHPGSPSAGGRSMSVRFADEVPLPTSVSSPPNGIASASAAEASGEVLEAPRKSGFDPSLLNPMSPTDIQSSVPTDPPDNPFGFPTPTEAAVETQQSAPQSVHGALNGLPSEAQVLPNGDSDHPMDETSHEQLAVEGDTSAEHQTQPEQPMEVERSPTPPLPDFHLDEGMLEHLKTYLRDATGSLNVEQLEQLRATCLGIVWRHRAEWDRDGLLRELKEEARTFVEEVALDDMEVPSP